MPLTVAFHLGLHRLPKYLFIVFRMKWVKIKGLNEPSFLRQIQSSGAKKQSNLVLMTYVPLNIYNGPSNLKVPNKMKESISEESVLII